MKRKLLMMLAAFVAAACLFSGCGDKEGQSSLESSSTLDGPSETTSDVNTSETDSGDSSDETEDWTSTSSETPVDSDSGEEESSGEADASRPPEGSSSAVSKPSSSSSTTSRPSSSSSSSSRPSSSSSSSSRPSSSSSSSSRPSSSSSSSAAESSSTAAKSCAEIYAAAISGVTLPDMMSLSGEDLNVVYGEVDLTGISDYSINAAAMMVHASEVVIFKYEDQTGRKNAMEIINTRAANLVSLWERYLPDQYELVEARQIVEKNGYILFVVAEDADQIVSQFEAAVQ